MAATPITKVTRYYPKGVLKWSWVPSIANKNSPTRSELNAGTDISPDLAGWEGWTTTSEFKDAPDVNSRFTPKVPGGVTAEDSSLTMYIDPSGADSRQLMPKDASGFVVRFGGGDVPGRKMSVFPVTVGSISTPYEIDEVPVATFSFAITAEPAEDVTVPA